MKTALSLRRVRGVSLIELLVSIAIGLVVVAAVLVSFVDSGKAGRYQAALGQMNQDAQVALNMLSREIQLAGYVSPNNSLGVNVYPLFGCDATSSTTPGVIPFVNAAVAGQPTCSATVAAPTISALEVVYEVDAYNTIPSGGNGTDCAGTAALAVPPIRITRNRYFVDRVAGGRPELYCASDAPTSPGKAPIMENVEDMQLWYGVFSATVSPNQIIRYAQAGEVNAQPAGEWGNIMAVRVCLLMRSAEPVLTNEDTPSYVDCRSATVPYTDRFLRRAYYTTATVRSKMPA
jgi:type IV pilus assembly protein PilW